MPRAFFLNAESNLKVQFFIPWAYNCPGFVDAPSIFFLRLVYLSATGKIILVASARTYFSQIHIARKGDAVGTRKLFFLNSHCMHGLCCEHSQIIFLKLTLHVGGCCEHSQLIFLNSHCMEGPCWQHNFISPEYSTVLLARRLRQFFCCCCTFPVLGALNTHTQRKKWILLL